MTFGQGGQGGQGVGSDVWSVLVEMSCLPFGKFTKLVSGNLSSPSDVYRLKDLITHRDRPCSGDSFPV